MDGICFLTLRSSGRIAFSSGSSADSVDSGERESSPVLGLFADSGNGA
jgi:hypothetical protein